MMLLSEREVCTWVCHIWTNLLCCGIRTEQHNYVDREHIHHHLKNVFDFDLNSENWFGLKEHYHHNSLNQHSVCNPYRSFVAECKYMIRLCCHTVVFPSSHDYWSGTHWRLNDNNKRKIHRKFNPIPFPIDETEKTKEIFSYFTDARVRYFIQSKSNFAITLKSSRQIGTYLMLVTCITIQCTFVNVLKYKLNLLEIFG